MWPFSFSLDICFCLSFVFWFIFFPFGLFPLIPAPDPLQHRVIFAITYFYYTSWQESWLEVLARYLGSSPARVLKICAKTLQQPLASFYPGWSSLDLELKRYQFFKHNAKENVETMDPFLLNTGTCDAKHSLEFLVVATFGFVETVFWNEKGKYKVTLINRSSFFSSRIHHN